jgi:hypothetical protein
MERRLVEGIDEEFKSVGPLARPGRNDVAVREVAHDPILPTPRVGGERQVIDADLAGAARRLSAERASTHDTIEIAWEFLEVPTTRRSDQRSGTPPTQRPRRPRRRSRRAHQRAGRRRPGSGDSHSHTRLARVMVTCRCSSTGPTELYAIDRVLTSGSDFGQDGKLSDAVDTGVRLSRVLRDQLMSCLGRCRRIQCRHRIAQLLAQK